MDLDPAIKLMLVASCALFVTYFVLNAVLSFISRFSKQLQVFSKNLLVMAGTVYGLALLAAPEWTVEMSAPLLRLAARVVPGLF